jgi:gas vesicle protein
MTTQSKIVLGILGAAAAGVIIGILVAPEKGAELRTKIKSSAGDMADQITGWFNRGKEEMENLKDRTTREARTMQPETAEM